MPTKAVNPEMMAVGKKSGGKHWTQAEVEARQSAADGVRRKTRVVMICPDWLDEEGRKVWKRVRRQIHGLDLLDNLDGDMLAIYCDAVAKYRQVSKGLIIQNDRGEELADEEHVKTLQAWARLVSGYADKLGFTPAARARLVKKKADEIQDDFEDQFGG